MPFRTLSRPQFETQGPYTILVILRSKATKNLSPGAYPGLPKIYQASNDQFIDFFFFPFADTDDLDDFQVVFPQTVDNTVFFLKA